MSVQLGSSGHIYTILKNDVLYIEFPAFELVKTVTIYTISLFWKSYISILGYWSRKSSMGCILKASLENRIYSSFVFKLGKGDFIYTISINAIAYILFAGKSDFGLENHIYDFEKRMIVYSRAKFEIFQTCFPGVF